MFAASKISRRGILVSIGAVLFFYVYTVLNSFASPRYFRLFAKFFGGGLSLGEIYDLFGKKECWKVLLVTGNNLLLLAAIILIVIIFRKPLGRFELVLKNVNRRYLLVGIIIFSLVNIVRVLKYRNMAFPMAGDEHAYLFQANLLGSGRLWAPSHPLNEFFVTDYVIWDNAGKTYAEYTMGAPVFLALGVLAGAPWLVNPLLGALSLLFLYLIAARFYDESIALYGVVLISASRYVIEICASYNSHALSLFCLSGCLYFFLKTLDDQAWYYPVLSGLFWGIAVNTRQLTAFSFALPFWIWGITRLMRGAGRSKLLPMGLFFAGCIFPVLGLMAVNTIQNGGPLVFGHSVYSSPDVKSYGFSGEYSFIHALGAYFYRVRTILNVLITQLFSPALFVVLLLFSCLGRGKNRLIVWVSFMSVSVFYLPVFSSIWHIRYYFVPAILLVFIIVLGLRYLGVWLEGRFEGVRPDSFILVFVIFCLLYHFKGFSFAPSRQILRYMRPYRVVEEAGVNNALVFVKGVRFYYPEWYCRNSPDYDDDVLYVRDLGEKNAKLMDYYPNRVYYRYDMGNLTPIEKE